MNIVQLPWPPKELSPNCALHWGKKAKFKKKYREVCWALTLEAKLKVNPGDLVPMEITFYPPDRRLRDADNMIASIKAGLDGVADALRVDDRDFLPTFKFSKEVKGIVEIKLTA